VEAHTASDFETGERNRLWREQRSLEGHWLLELLHWLQHASALENCPTSVDDSKKDQAFCRRIFLAHCD